MKDVLIPLGLLLFIGLFVYAIVQTARKQGRAKASVFQDFADRYGLRYLEEDDGKAQDFAGDFDGIGRFSSPSLGKVLPEDVVDGTMDGSAVILFRHSIRFSEGWAREWFVTGVISNEPIAERCSVQFCRGRADKGTMYLEDSVVKEHNAGGFDLLVRSASASGAGKFVDEGILERLAGLAGKLPFRPEVQVRGNRIAAYLADRNATVEDAETLETLLKFTNDVANA